MDCKSYLSFIDLEKAGLFNRPFLFFKINQSKITANQLNYKFMLNYKYLDLEVHVELW